MSIYGELLSLYRIIRFIFVGNGMWVARANHFLKSCTCNAMEERYTPRALYLFQCYQDLIRARISGWRVEVKMELSA